jgi:dolichyl-diphosphooligosaccharide--protein glycosyltransferase
MSYRKIRPIYYPVALVVIGGIALGAFYLINPDLLKTMLSHFNIFAPTGASAQTTIEMQPFLDPTNTGAFSTTIAWGNFNTSFFLGPWWLVLVIFAAAGLSLFYRYYVRGSTAVSLFVFLVPVLVAAAVFAGISADPVRITEVVMFPGLALIALGVLVYLFIRKKDAGESYWGAVFRVVAILAVIMVELLLYGYGHHVLSLIPLAVLFCLLFWPGDGQKNWLLFLVWTLVILALTLPQRRYAYYLVINVALLSAYLFWQMIWLAGINKLGVSAAPIAIPVHGGKTKAKKKEIRRGRPGTATYVTSAVLAGLAVFLLTFAPSIAAARGVTITEQATYAPSDAWVSSLLWMKDNTPEPFGDPEAYYRQYEAPPAGETFDYPPTAYGVTSWWDYGYWITQIAHRIPSANPAQDPAPVINVANLFLSEDNATAQELMAKMGSSYVIVDTTVTGGKFWAVATWAAQPLEKYYDVFYELYQGQYQAAQLYYPAYYDSLVVRLYNFDGKAVTESKPTVVTYTDNVDANGTSYKLVSNAQQFDSYQAALDYVNSQTSGKNVIVGVSPFVSPIPLEAVPDFQLVHSSEQGTSVASVGLVPEVKIFEYTGNNK